jgi:hypothetical protein
MLTMRIPSWRLRVPRWPRHIAILALLLFLLIPAQIKAQDKNAEQEKQQGEQTESQDGQTQPPKTKTGESVKLPPPPLFTKHSRGMYRNGLGLQVIDATPQSPPLEADDPGVPDKGCRFNWSMQHHLS